MGVYPPDYGSSYVECDDCWPIKDLPSGAREIHYQECFRCTVARVKRERDLKRKERWFMVLIVVGALAAFTPMFLPFF